MIATDMTTNTLESSQNSLQNHYIDYFSALEAYLEHHKRVFDYSKTDGLRRVCLSVVCQPTCLQDPGPNNLLSA